MRSLGTASPLFGEWAAGVALHHQLQRPPARHDDAAQGVRRLRRGTSPPPPQSFCWDETRCLVSYVCRSATAAPVKDFGCCILQLFTGEKAESCPERGAPLSGARPDALRISPRL